MPDHTKKCWYCGSWNMEPIEGYFKCGDCGATHVRPRALSLPDVEPATITVSLKGGFFSYGGHQPTKTAINEARRAREEKG
ncbi:MAG: hypothetical protein KAT75_00695 [Dehalococcoidia bacterium]|nr:hypothetical protein [Dehalococcoidia bacterium]